MISSDFSFTNKFDRYLHFDGCGDDDVDVFYVIQADNHQENLVVAEVKKLETDGLVNFISMNEVRYITEYNQVVGAFLVLLWKHHSASFTPKKFIQHIRTLCSFTHEATVPLPPPSHNK